ncbi:MAG: rRNA pseudouridine synthase [Lachnospiraceae bacterium]|nr:rRNA pseudouridine synthase [Lachnospiraceae bacterium]
MEKDIRLNKFIAEAGICSRRDADVLITDGRVTVNGSVATQGMKVSDQDTVCVNGKAIKRKSAKVILAFYKPEGVVCTERDAHARVKIGDIVDYPERVTYAGRLDKDSEGLILLTNDGDLINSLMKGSNRHEKEYIVKTDRPVTEGFLEAMSQGVYLRELDVTTRPCTVEQIGKYTFRIILTQGLNRQIRRMCAEQNMKVVSLKRIRVANIELGNLKKGSFRELSPQETEGLMHILEK